MRFVSKFRWGVIAGACLLGFLAVVGTVRPQSPENVAITATPRAREIDTNRGAAALCRARQEQCFRRQTEDDSGFARRWPKRVL
jgi:hypothetical protein